MPDYIDSVLEWRQLREEALKASDGWLTVAGLFWLEQGQNNVEGLRFLLTDTIVTHNGNVLRPDVDTVVLGQKTFFVIVRGPKIGLRMRDQQSVFLRDFKGLKWFPVNPDFQIIAHWIPYSEPQPRFLNTVIDVEEEYNSPGIAEFTMNGVTCQLEPVLSGTRLFFVFRDATSGNTTYGASRFLYADAAVDGKVILDFNKAYSPPCAFTPFATCPLPLDRNRLTVAIEAGELKP